GMPRFTDNTLCLGSDCAAKPAGVGDEKDFARSIAGAAALMTIAPANAADLGLRPMYAAPPAFTWSGWYIGGNIRGGWGRDTVSIPNLAATTGVSELAGVSLPSLTGNTKGVLGGGQVGCNYQFGLNLVIGIEGDGEATGVKGDVTESVSF